MGYIFVDKESEGGGMEKMRQQMRRNMRYGGGYRGGNSGGSGSGSYNDGYRRGYREGWEDMENEWDDDNIEYRRRRDSRGRYM